MIGYNFKYRGQSFSDLEFDKIAGEGIRLTQVDWTQLVTSHDQKNKQGEHGIVTSGTYIRGRLIDIRGTIEANSRSARNYYRQIIQNFFLPPFNPSPINKGYHDFEFYDDDDQEWVLRAKVLNTPSYTPDFADFLSTGFQIQLICEDPVILSKASLELNHMEGFYGGVELDTELEVALDDYGYIATIANSGLWKAPLKVTITANDTTGENIRLINTINNTYIGVQTPLQAGDVLVINSYDYTIKRNGINASGDRINGSIFQELIPGNNLYIVRDDSQIIGDGLSVDVIFEWNNVKM